jgi:precorrin-6Y C5,15-methyltransferase (decarboxylating)
VLATGDPLCHGIAAFLTGKLGAARSIFCRRRRRCRLPSPASSKPWQDLRIASCHSADAGEWFVGATPAHGLYAVMRAIALHPLVAVFTGPENGPARLARALITAGYGEEVKLSVACRLLLPDEALRRPGCGGWPPAASFPSRTSCSSNARAIFRSPLSVSTTSNTSSAHRRKGLITKQEARACRWPSLRLAADAVVWDIGAGSGSVGLEAARLAPLGHVWAIEKNTADAANARANAERFRVGNYTLVEGKAPAHLDTWPDPDAVFIGGSGGELGELIRLIMAA